MDCSWTARCLPSPRCATALPSWSRVWDAAPEASPFGASVFARCAATVLGGMMPGESLNVASKSVLSLVRTSSGLARRCCSRRPVSSICRQQCTVQVGGRIVWPASAEGRLDASPHRCSPASSTCQRVGIPCARGKHILNSIVGTWRRLLAPEVHAYAGDTETGQPASGARRRCGFGHSCGRAGNAGVLGRALQARFAPPVA